MDYEVEIPVLSKVPCRESRVYGFRPSKVSAKRVAVHLSLRRRYRSKIGDGVRVGVLVCLSEASECGGHFVD